MNERIDTLRAALWKAVAQACQAKTTAGHYALLPEERTRAMEAAKHVEQSLALSAELLKEAQS